jgi:hypothetical protein
MRSPRFIFLVLMLTVTFIAGGAIAATAAPMTGTFVGYLMDVACGAAGHGEDGSDTFASPQDHTKGCLIACKGSGFGVMIRSGDQYALFKFDPAGSDLALKQVLTMTKKDKDIMVSVDGTLDNGIIKVKSIKEANIM